MSLGQSIFTFLVFTLLVLFTQNTNRLFSSMDLQFAQNRYRLEALSILNSLAQEATQYVFDEAVLDTNLSKTLSDFAEPIQLGFDSNDNNTIDDFDDYNGYSSVEIGRSGVAYQVEFKVDYVTLVGDQIVHSNARQYHKRLRILLYDNYDPPLIFHWKDGNKVKDTLKVELVHSYWFYN